jgi:hypothetical protein
MNLDVKVSFRPNEINEKECQTNSIQWIKSRIKSKSDLKEHYPTIEKRVVNSSILENLLSQWQSV